VVDEVSSQPERPLAASLRLFADLDAGGQARSFVRDFCLSSGFSSEFCDVAVLLVGELVKNALVNSGQEPTVEIQRARDGLRIGVHGSSPDIPAQRASAERRKIKWFEIHAMAER
jgi:anti-sigma regulatory factor (Ser/Thr protein kinase)